MIGESGWIESVVVTGAVRNAANEGQAVPLAMEDTEPDKPPNLPDTVEELKAALTARGLEIPKDAKKAKLEKLPTGSGPKAG